MSTQAFEKPIGHRKIYAVVDGHTATIFANCEISNACIKFQVPANAAQEYFSGTSSRLVQDVFPDLRKELREILITGIGPAEFEEMAGHPMPDSLEAFIQKYQPLGYHFD